MKKIVFITLCIGVIILLVILTTAFFMRPQLSSPSIISKTALEGLPTKDASGIDTSHLAPKLIPPTNKWFSGVALQKTPQTVFPSPLSVTPTENAFTFSLPVTSASDKVIFATQPQPIQVTIKGATNYLVTRYDELSVDITYRNNTTQLAVVTLTAGSPYIFMHALSEHSFSVQADANFTSTENNSAVIKNSVGRAIVTGFDGAKITQDGNQITGNMPANSMTTLYHLPASFEGDPLKSLAGNRITESKVMYQKKDNDYETSFSFTTANNKPTVYSLLPHQQNTNKQTIGYDTLYGKQQLISGNQFSFVTAAVPVKESLQLGDLPVSEKALLVTTLRRDINATQFTAEDTYFGGKSLYRSAQLLDLARQLNESAIADSIQQKLRNELTTWLSPSNGRIKKYFYYDTKIKGIVGETIAFGSEAFNDHHFHYGYFIYAASILAKYDPVFLEQNGSIVNLLAADIANYETNDALPLRRSFDPYFGHAWASGSAPFNDGNNQESTSEAINAWVATSLWATQTKNTTLELEANWMLSNETAATGEYWMNFNQNEAPYNQGYGHSLISLNWGGKREYSTFFSAEKNALLGILLIPMNPTMAYQSEYGERITTHVNEAITPNNYNVQFGDYILMYSSLQNNNGQLDIAKALLDEVIDGANSRSYMYAWIMSRDK